MGCVDVHTTTQAPRNLSCRFFARSFPGRVRLDRRDKPAPDLNNAQPAPTTAARTTTGSSEADLPPAEDRLQTHGAASPSTHEPDVSKDPAGGAFCSNRPVSSARVEKFEKCLGEHVVCTAHEATRPYDVVGHLDATPIQLNEWPVTRWISTSCVSWHGAACHLGSAPGYGSCCSGIFPPTRGGKKLSWPANVKNIGAFIPF